MQSLQLIEVDGKKGVCKIEGVPYFVLGFGTYPLKGEVCKEAVAYAAEQGYQIIDTAMRYKNFDAISRALAGKKRSDFYLISKVWHDQQLPIDVDNDLEKTLKELKTPYLDAYLLHWPNHAIPIEKSLHAMDILRREKKIRHIGLSNVSVNHLKRALEVGVPLTWVQVEMSPYFYDPTLLEFCKKHFITVQAWSPLGRGRVSEDPLLGKIGKKYGKTPGQVALRWITQHGCIALPSSKNVEHIGENREAIGFSLSLEEQMQMNARAKEGMRKRVTKELIGFDDEFDFSYEQCWPKKV